jgi:hypothetical protein
VRKKLKFFKIERDVIYVMTKTKQGHLVRLEGSTVGGIKHQ